MKVRTNVLKMKSAISIICICLAAALWLAGCSDSDSPSGLGDQTPEVSISNDDISLGITETFQFSAAVTGGSSATVEWYVDSISGGNSAIGTITQGNPATYTAPDILPSPSSVTVTAVSSEDSTAYDTCSVNLTFNTIYVNSSSGDDDTGVGGVNKPFRTITKGLEVSGAGMKVLAAPGVYDDSTGEVFPIEVPDSVTLEGEDWTNCVISLDAESLDKRNAVRLKCTDCSFRKFTVQEPDGGSPYWSIAVSVTQSVRARADSIRCLERASYSVLRVEYDHGSIVENCYFVVSDGNYFDRGLEIVFTDDGNNTILRNLTVSGFGRGLFFNSMQNTLVEGCNLSGNEKGVYLCCYQSSTSQPNPDFGGGARGSTGGNDFSGTNIGLDNSTHNVIYAMYNTWDNSPPVEGDDFSNPDSLSGGAVITD